MENYNFPGVVSFVYHFYQFFYHVFIIFASSGGIDEKSKIMEIDKQK